MNPFGNVKFIPGLGWVEQGEYTPSAQDVRRGASSLGDESAVMMISGLGSLGGTRRRGLGNVALSRSGSIGVRPGTDIVLFGYVLPWWMWILVLGSAAYAGWLLMQKLKKG